MVKNFEVIDHGIEHTQYFQGCGVSFSPFTNVVTGIGDNPAEAIDDCLEQMATNGCDVPGMEKRILEQEGWDIMPTTPDRQTIYGDIDEIYCHVSIRWN